VAGEILDPRLAQVSRLKEANVTLKERLAKQETELAELTEFKHRALSRIAAQHLEIECLREHAEAGSKVVALSARKPAGGTIGSCS
jgi:hypothetical protein